MAGIKEKHALPLAIANLKSAQYLFDVAMNLDEIPADVAAEAIGLIAGVLKTLNERCKPGRLTWTPSPGE